MPSDRDLKIEFIETIKRNDIDEIAEIEKKYYGEKALSKDILVPAAHFLGFILVAKTDKVVGYTIFLSMKDRKQMYCSAITVLPEYRNKGIATKLLEIGEQKCIELGIESIIATSKPMNIASIKILLNKRKWLIIDFLHDFFRDNSDRFLFKKYLNKDFRLVDGSTLDLQSIDEIRSLIKKGYFGIGIINNEKLELFRLEEGNNEG